MIHCMQRNFLSLQGYDILKGYLSIDFKSSKNKDFCLCVFSLFLIIEKLLYLNYFLYFFFCVITIYIKCEYGEERERKGERERLRTEMRYAYISTVHHRKKKGCGNHNTIISCYWCKKIFWKKSRLTLLNTLQ